ncbi:AI-2E family transporter, partial [Salmonella enterica subsp. enterica serovar Infantis]
WLGLALMDIQFALMWGVLAFLLNYVPNIGSVISAVPPMIQALVKGTDKSIPTGPNSHPQTSNERNTTSV